ncbi:MAG: DJ-1/PfpI family protein [Proteobacteria bacterium]|nr:DJ-1/PfpI family protein [Pseudomonadota bacterium]
MGAFGFLAFPGFEELDLIGPWEMATMWRAYADGPACAIVSVAAGPVPCAKGLQVIAAHGYADCPPLDYLLVPGGFAAFDAMKDSATLDFVRTRAASAKAVLSVCTGSFILAAAGVLKPGMRGATHWKATRELRALGVDVAEDRWTRDGQVWSSAGVSAGMDLLLAFIAAEAGEAAAAAVQLNAEYYPDGRLYGGTPGEPRASAYIRALT